MTIPIGLCQCGCGGATPLAKQSSARRGHINGQPLQFIHGHNNHDLRLDTIGRRILRKDYIMVRQPDHPSADETGYVYEHWLVAEKALGKALPPGVVVHHVNEVKTENRNNNLAILPGHGYHAALHRRLRIVKAGGNPFTQSVCRRCGAVKDLQDFYLMPSGIPQANCKACVSDLYKKRYAEKKRVSA
jgi:hypothetical protein